MKLSLILIAGVAVTVIQYFHGFVTKSRRVYEPKPEDTSSVTVCEDMETLKELLARNTHENWAKARIAQGWRPGAERNDVRKEHPCLVPYDELPEEEKEYDRRTSMETIKMILKEGYVIQKRA